MSDPADIRKFTPCRGANAALCAGGVFLLVVLKLADVSEHNAPGLQLLGWKLPETCIHKRTHGGDCASCGLTRSVVSFFDAEFERSRAFHTSGFAIAAFLLLQIILRGLFAFRTFAPYWKWDVVVTTVAVLCCFGEFILRLPQPV